MPLRYINWLIDWLIDWVDQGNNESSIYLCCRLTAETSAATSSGKLGNVINRSRWTRRTRAEVQSLPGWQCRNTTPGIIAFHLRQVPPSSTCSGEGERSCLRDVSDEADDEVDNRLSFVVMALCRNCNKIAEKRCPTAARDVAEDTVQASCCSSRYCFNVVSLPRRVVILLWQLIDYLSHTHIDGTLSAETVASIVGARATALQIKLRVPVKDNIIYYFIFWLINFSLKKLYLNYSFWRKFVTAKTALIS